MMLRIDISAGDIGMLQAFREYVDARFSLYLGGDKNGADNADAANDDFALRFTYEAFGDFVRRVQLLHEAAVMADAKALP